MKMLLCNVDMDVKTLNIPTTEFAKITNINMNVTIINFIPNIHPSPSKIDQHEISPW